MPDVTGPVRPVDEQNVLPAVIVVVNESHARAHGFGQPFLAEAAVVMDEVNPRGTRDVFKMNAVADWAESGARMTQAPYAVSGDGKNHQAEHARGAQIVRGHLLALHRILRRRRNVPTARLIFLFVGRFNEADVFVNRLPLEIVVRVGTQVGTGERLR